MITSVVADIDKLKPPTGFAGPLADYKATMNEVASVFTTYADKISLRKKEAADEQEIRDSHSHFHQAYFGGRWASVSDTPKAVAYFNIINCALPDLLKEIKKINKPPDTQYVVETIYKTCKNDSTFADKLRKECFAKRNQSIKRDKKFKSAAFKMSGDDRDLYAINDCFKRANHGFAFEELKAVAEVFGKYRNKARGKILQAVAKVKQELAE
jgi:hypothetical protein